MKKYPKTALAVPALRQTLSSNLPAKLLSWYKDQARILPWRLDHDPYRVWISEIMLQQTQVATVIPYYERFLAAFPTIDTLAQAQEEQLLKYWEGLGYYSRARNLLKAAKAIAALHGGVFPKEYGDIRSLPGIGDYTAGAIASICFDLPTPAVDGNVLRVVARLMDLHTSIDEASVKSGIRNELSVLYTKIDAKKRGDLTQALMELGALLCVSTSTPDCAACPLKADCKAFSAGTVAELPLRRMKKEKRDEDISVFLLSCGEQFALKKRPPQGLLASMWELPNMAGAFSETEVAGWALKHGLRLASCKLTIQHTHVFTHVRWHMTGFNLACIEMTPEFVWATRAEIAQDYPLPAAFQKFMVYCSDK
jgi:A/G-specific adenine glycosylase